MVDDQDNTAHSTRLQIDRPIYTHARLEKEFGQSREESKPRAAGVLRQVLRALNPINFLRIFTVFQWVSEYNFKSNLLADLISGITVGIFHIPAALAYGALTSLNPVNGLYTSFYPGLTYVIFGTSRHLSVGTFAVISLMVFSTISRLETEYFDALTGNRTLALSTDLPYMGDDRDAVKLSIATSLAFWCGVVQIAFSFLKLGYVSKYLSQPLLKGFTTAAAFHVLTTQAKHILGIYAPSKRHKIFKIFFTYYYLLAEIKLINWCAIIFSIVIIATLLIFKAQINERFKKQLRNFQIPIELIVIVASTAIVFLFRMDEKFDLKIVGDIPTGLPPPSVPYFSLLPSLINDAVIISVVSFATSISVSDFYARKHKYSICANKELFALGAANIVGSFFRCFVSCGSLARTAVLEGSGGKTQLVSVIASVVVLTVMLWISMLLKFLPKACLGAIIIAALVNLLKQVRDLPRYWRLDKLDFLVWIVTFSSCIVIDIDYGLVIGVLVLFFLNTYRSQHMSLKELGQIRDYELHCDKERFVTNDYRTVKIVRPTHSLFYINSDFFRQELNAICPLKSALPDKTICQNCVSNYGCSCCSRKRGKETDGDDENDTRPVERVVVGGESVSLRKSSKIEVEAIIIDMTSVQFVDEAGCNCIKQVVKEYASENVKILLANCNDNVIAFMNKMKLYEELEEKIYVSVSDAVQSTIV